MDDDLNAKPPGGPTAGRSRDELTHALEQMAAEATARTKSASTASPEACKETGPWPDVNDWLRLVAGEASPQEQERLLSHASLCTSCLVRLRECHGLLSRDFSSTEFREFEQFAVSTPVWRHRAAVELARTPHRFGPSLQFKLFGWSAGAATALAMVLAAALWWRFDHAPERLLAQAYTQDRIFELRIPGAKFAPVTPATHLRGASARRESTLLLAARERIEQHLEKSPGNDHWLQLQARAEMLDERYDAAIDTLDRVLAGSPVTPGLLADDGMAYFLRGVATGSQNDRATALDTLRRADEMAPDDPVVLFNEAVVMEDRGQVINAVETWNRYLKFERDPAWRAEGQRHLSALEDKLSGMKTHQSRIERHLATPGTMRALAADEAALASIDEELSTTMLPQLLSTAYPPPERSRGSPCDDRCTAARALLRALAASLERNHQDSWLTSFLPPDTRIMPTFPAAAHALGSAIDADTRGDYPDAQKPARAAQQLFHQLGNPAGEARAVVELAFALQRSFNFAACHRALIHQLKAPGRFTWIRAQATAVDAGCDVNAGSASNNFADFSGSLQQARDAHYTLLELRARNVMSGAALESGDTEDTWRITTESLRLFYQGDYPPFRAATVDYGLGEMEELTPRVHLELLINREACGVLAFTQNHALQSAERSSLIRAALRAGSPAEAQSLLAKKAGVCGAPRDEKPPPSLAAEANIEMANLYLERGDLAKAAQALDAVPALMAGMDNPVLSRRYAALRGEFELSVGHPEAAESLLHAAILNEELQAQGAGKENVVFAEQNRALYANLADVWLAEHRPAGAVLALWERYRLRILGQPVPACANRRLDCLAPALSRALQRRLADTNGGLLLGQIVLHNRVLLYCADAHDVSWSEASFQRADVLAAAAALERVASSPATSQISVNQASRRIGRIFFDGLRTAPDSGRLLLLEPDPLLGNVPWAAAATAEGPLGLHFAMQETPSILMTPARRPGTVQPRATGRMLVIGASVTNEADDPLPEVLDEARLVARVANTANPLLAAQATEPQIVLRLASASLIHFAGHAAEFDGETRLLLAPSNIADRNAYLDRGVFLRYPPRAAQLVVFSACSSGKREAGWEHGMGDIVDTLASLGVPEVVATRWKIDSASAVPLMDAFYRGLARGESVPLALSKARQSLARDPRFSHPYYWAAYHADSTGHADLREVFYGGKQ